ncbi:hypothetical protein K439DRAFT_1665947 [Ramaria rubella]|nr:hypothetical protein K439DRAFT_1665947 [Ramaria rubella]
MSDDDELPHDVGGLTNLRKCPPANDKTVNQILVDYHCRGIQNRRLVSRMLRAEYGITMSEATVTRRCKDIGLKGSNTTTLELSETVKRRLVVDQLDKDPARHQGPTLIKEAILAETGLNLTRDYIEDEMKLQDPEGFELREPNAKKVNHRPLVSVGIHEEWSGDGHDKLSKIGFPVYGIRDKWSGKWLGLWVIPNNRLNTAVAYLYLTLIEEQGGMPIQTMTDCGSETTIVYGLANVLREAYSPDLPIEEVPAHRFLKSINNITIKRGWIRTRLQWGENVKIHWEEGNGVYDPTNPQQYELVQWLWSTLVQSELDNLRDRFNNHPVRFDKKKVLPSGVSPNVAYALHSDYGAINCIQAVNIDVVGN